jgi:hypothetical protein
LAIEGFGVCPTTTGEVAGKEWNEGYGKPGFLLPENSKRSANREPNVALL